MSKTLPLPSLDRFLRGRSKRRWVYTSLTLLVVFMLLLADRFGLLLNTRGDMGQYDHKQFKVVRVLDGQTLELDVPDGQQPYTTVHLWGVAAPKLATQNPPRPAEPFAEKANDLARYLAANQMVSLMLEPHRLRDDHGHLLAFVELPDGTLLNEDMIFAGLARADSRWSYRYLQRFEELQQKAQQAKRGIWGPGDVP